jgi:hypothetical protein
MNKTTDKIFNRPMTGNLSIPILNKSPQQFLKKIRSYSNENTKNKNGNYILTLNNNDIKKVQKGTNFQKQYKRRTKEELKEIFSRKLNFNKKNLVLDNNIIENNIDEEINYKTKELKKIKSEKFKKIKNQELINQMNKTEYKNDKYLPTNLMYHIKNLKKETIKNKIQINNLTEKNSKIESNYSSDIFFLKPFNEKKEGKKKNFFRKKNELMMSSDIFNRQNPISTYEYKKSGEKQLITISNKKTFNSNTENNSFFQEIKQNIPSSITSSNSFFNILSPDKKNEFYHNQSIKIYFKPTNISQYYDSVKISKKYSKPYQKAYSENKKIFHKTNNMCSEYLNNYNSGKDLYKKPFESNCQLK